MPPPYRDWPDGKPHSIPYARHLQNLAFKTPGGPNLAQIAGGQPFATGPPPVGSYDPGIDYNASASQRGYDQYAGDAQTAFEHGQQDYSLNLGDLTRGRDRNLADLLTNENRLGEDYKTRTGENTRQFGILGRQQAEGAAQRGITSAGLIGRSNAVRGENQQREQGQIDLWRNRGVQDIGTQRTRTNEDFTRGKTGLDLGNARTFGGFNGVQMINPVSGKPEFGSLLTSLTRAGGENNAFQTAAAGQRAQGAAARGYSDPLTRLLMQLRGGG